MSKNLSKFEKAFYLICLIVLGILFFLVNLHKGTIGSGFKMFSRENIIITSAVFIIGIPLIVFIKKIIEKKKEK